MTVADARNDVDQGERRCLTRWPTITSSTATDSRPRATGRAGVSIRGSATSSATSRSPMICWPPTASTTAPQAATSPAAEELMADAVGAAHAFFSTCGSSLSVKAAMMAVAGHDGI